MAKSHKIPRFRLSHGAYFWTPCIDGKQRWILIGYTYSDAIQEYAKREAKRSEPRKDIAALAARFKVDRHGKLAEATVYNYEIWGRDLLSVFGHMLPNQIVYSHGKEWLIRKDYTVSAQRQMQLLSTWLSHAREIGWLDGANPLSGLRKGEKSRRTRYISNDEWFAVLAECDPLTSIAARFAKLTSLRRQDFLRLKWSDEKPDGLYCYIKKTKQNARIPWTTDLRALIEEARGMRGKVASVFIFAERNGQVLKGDTMLGRWKRAGDKAGVANITIHDIRRKRLTDVQQVHGIGSQQAQNLAVHSDPKTTKGYFVAPVIDIHLPRDASLEAASSTGTADHAKSSDNSRG